MIVLVHNILPPYRIPLFNALSSECHGEFMVLLARETHPFRRSWRVPWEEVRFKYRVLRTMTVRAGDRAVDVSVGVGAALAQAQPRAVILAGWDLPACWMALRWARRRNVPLYAWVESASATGDFRGRMSTALRRRFLQHCRGVIVPGIAAARFVEELAPGIPHVVAPNSVAASPNLDSGVPPHPRAVLFVGELSARKGADLVLSALPQLLRHFESVLIAGSGPLAPAATAAAAKDPRVRFLGFLDGGRLAPVMRLASVVLVPSRQDPWPLVAVEALTAGRPVVLGPGVGSAPDLEHIAGKAVLTMTDANPQTLAVAAISVSSEMVPLDVRRAFQPASVATRFLSILGTRPPAVDGPMRST